MQRIRAELGQTFFAITLLALSPGCSSSSDSAGDVDAGDTGHETEGTDTRSDGAEGGTCDKTGVCCCDGDVIEDVTCTAAGAPTCSKYTLYHGADCTRPCGPCTFSPSCFDAGPDTTPPGDTGSGADADTAADDGSCVHTDAGDACCCEGDVMSTVTCTASGPTCGTGFGLYFGDDCRCLPDRDTPCCLPHVFDAGPG